MDRSVGTILKEARKRRGIELSDVETVTRIRSAYLRAIEADDWDALPGGVYTRGFIRTYASFLGLDGERLATEYRHRSEGDAGQQPGPRDPAATAAGKVRARRWGGRGGGWLVAAGVLVVAALTIVALPLGDGEKRPEPPRVDGGRGTGSGDRRPATLPADNRPSGVSVSLTASAEVWVCLLGRSGRPLVDGQILGAGAAAGPFHSGSFTVSFGNGEVSMFVNGRKAEIPATSSPIGYAIDGSGDLRPLSETERPTCA
jgi:cytoskeleton protein RodZ